ncbi:MAG: hypothetical protein ABW189_02205 [Rickettsiales bacterium]
MPDAALPVEPSAGNAPAASDPSILQSEHSKFRWSALFKNGYFRFFVAATLLPTLVSGIYYAFVASDQYVSLTSFSVYAEQKNIDLGMVGAAYGLMDTQEKRDLLIVKDYIESPALLAKLSERLELKDIYRRPGADAIARLKEGATEEDFLDYYRGMIKITLNQDAGTIDLEVSAFAPADAQRIAKAVLDVTESFMNDMMTRIRNDDVAFDQKQLKEAENRVVEAMDEINRFRKSNNNLDPEKSGSGLFRFIQQLEVDKIKLNAELAALRETLSDRAFEVKQMKIKIAALTDAIDAQREKLLGSRVEPLSDVMQEYGKLSMRQDFALKRYEIALTSYEAAMVNAHRKSKYIVRVIEPKAPEISTKPKRLKKTFTVFVMSMLTSAITLLFAAGVRDHVNV